MSSAIVANEKGAKAVPVAMKCFDAASTQWSRRLCNMAEVPSMTTKTEIVRTSHIAKQMKRKMTPVAPDMPNAFPRVMSQRTLDN